MHRAVRGEGELPAERLVQAERRSVARDQEVLGAGRNPERHPLERGFRRRAPAGGRRPAGAGLGVGRRRAVGAGAVHRAQQHLQQVEGAAGLEAVGVGRDAAHGVERHRAADEARVPPPRPVGPRGFDGDAAFERRLRELPRDAADAAGGDAGTRRRPLRRPGRVEIALRNQLEDGAGAAAVGQFLDVDK